MRARVRGTDGSGNGIEVEVGVVVYFKSYTPISFPTQLHLFISSSHGDVQINPPYTAAASLAPSAELAIENQSRDPAYVC
jgi:hypothetical protein